MIEQLLKEKSVWETLAQTDKPLILYGMGDGADKVLKRLAPLHIKVSDVMASDDFVRGQTFHGFKVKKLSEIEEEYGDFIILPAFGSGRTEVIDLIRQIAGKHKILVPNTPVAGECVFDRNYLIKNGTEIDQAFLLMADEQSKKVFECMCYFQFTGELHYLFAMESSKDEAYSLLSLGDHENYLDLGAYRGDTIDEFLKYTHGSYRSITALEPDPKTYRKLYEAKNTMPNTNLINKGIWSHETEIGMDFGKGKGSALDLSCDKRISVTGIDKLAEEKKFTYIKMDVEGVEFIAISGGGNLIRDFKPKMNVACYHRCSDIFRLPAMIKRINPNYKIYMRHHPYIPCWDTNLYCI